MPTSRYCHGPCDRWTAPAPDGSCSRCGEPYALPVPVDPRYEGPEPPLEPVFPDPLAGIVRGLRPEDRAALAWAIGRGRRGLA